MPDINSYKGYIDQMKEYVSSPLYMQRLVARGIKNPKEIVKQRLDNLSKTTFGVAGPGGANTVQDENTRMPVINLAKGDDEGVLTHEIGHAAGGNIWQRYQSSYQRTKDPLQAGPQNLSVAENFDFYGLNQHLKSGKPGNKLLQRVTEDYVQQANNEREHQWWVDKRKRETGEDSDLGGLDPELQINPNPMSKYEAANMGELSEWKWDPHDVGSGEGYGDLTSVRFLLKKHGYTKSLGENLTSNIIKKAESDPKIKNDFHWKRMIKNYTKEGLIKLNNTIAKSGESKSNMA